MFLIFLSVVADHRVHPPEKPDLVQVMLTGRDKETGLGLTDESVKNNVRLEWVPVTVNATDFELAAAYIPNCWSASFISPHNRNALTCIQYGGHETTSGMLL